MTAGRSTARPATALVVAMLVLGLFGSSILLQPFARTAHAATAPTTTTSDCGFKPFDTDTVSLDGNYVDFGDTPATATSMGDAIVCWAAGRQRIVIKGTAFWNSTKAGCGIVGFGPTYYQETDPPVDGMTEVYVCSNNPSVPVTLTFSTTTHHYAALAISIYRRFDDGHIVNLAHTSVAYGDTVSGQ